MNNQDQLKPCPFCEGEIKNMGHGVSCRKCGLWIGDGTQAREFGGCIALCNTRPREQSLLDALKLAKEALDTCNMICAQSDDKDVIHTYDFDEGKVESAMKAISLLLQIERETK